MLKSEKQETVQGLTQLFGNAHAAFLLSYQGCTCAQLTKFRKELRQGDAKLAIVKNSLAKRALAEGGIQGLDTFLSGPVALVWAGEDPVTPAKVIAKHVKELDSLSIKAGYVEGEVVKASDVEYLASLPSREELICKLLALMNAPATRLVQMIAAPATQLVRTVDAWRAKLEEDQK